MTSNGHMRVYRMSGQRQMKHNSMQRILRYTQDRPIDSLRSLRTADLPLPYTKKA